MGAAAVVMDLAQREFPDWDKGVGRARLLTLYRAVRMTLVRLRRNHTYQELGADFGVPDRLEQRPADRGLPRRRAGL